MILLDTHIWVWLVDGILKNMRRVQNNQIQAIEKYLAKRQVYVSTISCWEIAKRYEKGGFNARNIGMDKWMEEAVGYTGIRLVALTPRIALESTRLASKVKELKFKDPGDQLIVATSMVYDLPLVTVDEKIRKYPGLDII